MLNLHGIGLSDHLPLAEDDYIVGMSSEQIDGDEWLLLRTHRNRRFMAQANDAGGLNVQELTAPPRGEKNG